MRKQLVPNLFERWADSGCTSPVELSNSTPVDNSIKSCYRDHLISPGVEEQEYFLEFGDLVFRVAHGDNRLGGSGNEIEAFFLGI